MDWMACDSNVSLGIVLWALHWGFATVWVRVAHGLCPYTSSADSYVAEPNHQWRRPARCVKEIVPSKISNISITRRLMTQQTTDMLKTGSITSESAKLLQWVNYSFKQNETNILSSTSYLKTNKNTNTTRKEILHRVYASHYLNQWWRNHCKAS